MPERLQLLHLVRGPARGLRGLALGPRRSCRIQPRAALRFPAKMPPSLWSRSAGLIPPPATKVGEISRDGRSRPACRTPPKAECPPFLACPLPTRIVPAFRKHLCAGSRGNKWIAEGKGRPACGQGRHRMQTLLHPRGASTDKPIRDCCSQECWRVLGAALHGLPRPLARPVP